MSQFCDLKENGPKAFDDNEEVDESFGITLLGSVAQSLQKLKVFQIYLFFNCLGFGKFSGNYKL